MGKQQFCSFCKPTDLCLFSCVHYNDTVLFGERNLSNSVGAWWFISPYNLCLIVTEIFFVCFCSTWRINLMHSRNNLSLFRMNLMHFSYTGWCSQASWVIGIEYFNNWHRWFLNFRTVHLTQDSDWSLYTKIIILKNPIHCLLHTNFTLPQLEVSLYFIKTTAIDTKKSKNICHFRIRWIHFIN